MIVADSCNAAPAGLEVATQALWPGFKLALVARGRGRAATVRAAGSMAASRGAVAKSFASEHQAAAWLLAESLT